MIAMHPAIDTEPIRVLAADLILVDWGPMTLTVAVWDHGIPRPVMAVQAAWTALESLRALSDFKGLLALKVNRIPCGRTLPPAVQRAVDAVRSVSHALSPMAAVAGASADEAAYTAMTLGAGKVIVNNGGDIAIRLAKEEHATVGIKAPDLEELVGRLNITGRHKIGGVASSGWSGRSLSTGVADLVTVWAENAGLADAAATLIAGRTTTSDIGVEQARAFELDPVSDLGDRLVTTRVDRLSGRRRAQAFQEGAKTASELLQRGLIRGCLISLQGDRVLLDPEGNCHPDITRARLDRDYCRALKTHYSF